jgi:hypothetical protein
MAVATRKECVSILADTNTFDAAGEFELVLVGGSAAAALSIGVGGTEVMALAAAIGTTERSPCIRITPGTTVTVALTGTGAKAFAVWK